MKKLFITILLFTCYFSFAQTAFYTTNGKNRITKSQVDTMKVGLAKRVSKQLGMKLYTDVKIDEVIEKKDSIIIKITFELHEKESKGKGKYSRRMEHLFDKELPNFNLKTLAGKNLDSKKLKGKPTMINFWFTKCPPCVDEMPFLNELQKKYKDKVNFISITYESKEDVESFLKKHPFTFKHLVNSRKYIDSLELQAYPLNVFLDENGIVKYVEGGLMYFKDKDGKMKIKDAKEFEKILNKLI